MNIFKAMIPPGEKGSAVVTALVLGTVLLIFVAGVSTFTSYRLSASTAEWNNLKALSIAEAGVSCALAELADNGEFQTNKVNMDADLSWVNTEETNKQNLENNSAVTLTVKSKTKGTYSATFGDGEFKVRVGNIPCQDNNKTLNIDESKCFVKVESMGSYNNTFRKVRALVQRRYPAREFLMYDGGYLSIVYGETGESNKTNMFSDGHLYGFKGIEVGQILMNKHAGAAAGTKQGFKNLELMTTPGNIYFYSDCAATFRDNTSGTIKKNTTFPTGGSYPGGKESKGEMPTQLLDEDNPPKVDESQAKFIKDGRHGGAEIGLNLSFDSYKNDAGLVIPPSDNIDYKLPAGWPGGSVKAKVLDFGTDVSPNTSAPTAANGIIYSDESLVIHGNPPRDLTIVSKKNVFISGDFNQKGGDAADKAQRYGLPENYDKNALADEDYSTNVKTLLIADGDKTKPATARHHQPVTVIANERIVFDYRNPVDSFENEIYPFMKFKLAAKLAKKPSDSLAETLAEGSVLKVNGTNDIQSEAATKDEIEQAVKDFFTAYPIGDTAKETTIATDIKNSYDTTSRKFSDSDLETVSQKVWKGYKENFPNKLNDPGNGVYTLLKDLRKKITGKSDDSQIKSDNWTDKNDDYLYFPEITTNGMFISCGDLNTNFYMGPDVSKLFDEIGNKAGQTGVGEQHSPHQTFVHRMYGSECKLRTNKANPYVSGGYDPGVRKKLYDPILPSFWTNTGKDVAAFVLIGWEDFRATPAEYTAF